jgi:hypothetical protein
MARLQPDDAPPERIGGLLGGKRTVEVGCRAQQAFHASAGIVEGGESFAENSDPWVASAVGGSSLIQSRGFSPIGCVARISGV